MVKKNQKNTIAFSKQNAKSIYITRICISTCKVQIFTTTTATSTSPISSLISSYITCALLHHSTQGFCDSRPSPRARDTLPRDSISSSASYPKPAHLPVSLDNPERTARNHTTVENSHFDHSSAAAPSLPSSSSSHFGLPFIAPDWVVMGLNRHSCLLRNTMLAALQRRAHVESLAQAIPSLSKRVRG